MACNSILDTLATGKIKQSESNKSRSQGRIYKQFVFLFAISVQATGPGLLYLILHFGCAATEQQLASGRIMKCSDEKLPGSWILANGSN